MPANTRTDQAVTRREHNQDAVAKRTQLVDPFGGVITDGNYTMQIDTSTAGTTIVGKAQIGTATTSSGWQIMKVVEDTTSTSITWADGTDEFVNTWTDRDGYTYS